MSPYKLFRWRRDEQAPDSPQASSTERGSRTHRFDHLRRHGTAHPGPATALSAARECGARRSEQQLRRGVHESSPSRSSPTGRASWLILKATLEAVRDGCDMFPPLKTTLQGVVSVMQLVDTVRDAQDEFAKLAMRISGLQTILSQYRGQDDIPPIIKKRLDQLLGDLRPIAEGIERKMKRTVIKRTITAPKDIQDVQESFEKLAMWVERFQLECNLNVEYRVEDITAENLLGKLHHVQGAGIDGQSGDACMENTRVGVLRDISAWSQDTNGARIFWLSGMAGIGKSAIARSICLKLRDAGALGASFFCSRGVRDDVTRIIPTIAESLARRSIPYRRALLEVLRQNPDAGHNIVKLQVEYLFKKPLREAFGNTSPALVVAVDALDECSDPKATKSMLSALVSRSPHIPLKFFPTSRPEQHIHPEFGAKCADLANIVRLHDIEQHIIESDIELYCSETLQEIRREWSPLYTFPEEWPPKAELTRVSKRAGKLFIYALTAMQFIAEENPVDRLQEMTRHNSGVGQPLTEPLDEMYSLVIDRAMNPKLRTNKEILQTKQVVAILLALREPLSLSSLGALIGTAPQDVRVMLSRLHAVIDVPPDNGEGAVTSFHASFEDYLTTPGRAPDAFRIDLSKGHQALAQACIRTMASDALCFNVSGCRTSYLPNSMQRQSFAPISDSLTYSCLQWIHHLIRVSNPPPILLFMYSVLREKTLFWIEVLSSTGHARLAVGLLHQLLTAENMRDCLSPEMVEFLRDAKEFVMLGHDAIEFSTPHIYLSVLPSVSPTSMIAKAFWPKFRSILKYNVTGIQRPRAQLLQMSGHTGTVFAVAFAPDGTHLVSGSEDGTVRIWDAKTGDLLLDPLEGHSHAVMSVAFSPDGTLVVSGSLDKTIQVWDSETGELVTGPLTGHNGGVQCVAVSPDGTRIVSGSRDCTLRLWNATTGDLVTDAFEGHTDAVKSVKFSPDGTQVVSASDDKTLRLWNVTTGRQVMEPLAGHNNIVWSVAFSPDGARIVSGSSDNTIRLWDAQTGIPIPEPLVGHSDPVGAVSFSPDGSWVVSGSADKTIRLWDAATGRPWGQPFEGHSDYVWSVGFSPDGSTLVSGSGDKTIRVWGAAVTDTIDPPDIAPRDTIPTDGSSPQGSLDDDVSAPVTYMQMRKTRSDGLQGHSGRVRCVAYTPDGTQIVSGSEDKTILVWDAHTGAPILGPIQAHNDLIKCIAVSPDGDYIASGSADQTIRIRDTRTGRPMTDSLSGHSDSVTSAVFSPDGARIVSGSYDRTVRVWDAGTGRLAMKPLEGHSNTIWSVAISPDGTQIVSGSEDTTLQFWHATTGERMMKPLKGHSKAVYSVAFSPDGSRIVSGSVDWTIRLWNARSGDAVLVPLRGHTKTVASVTFSPDGRTIASGSHDATVRLWDATTGISVMKPLEGHGDAVHSVAFSPDGTRVVSGSWDNTIRVWDVKPGDSWLGSSDGQSSTIWSALASSFRLPVALQPAQYLDPDRIAMPTVSEVSPGDLAEPHNPSYFRLNAGWIKGPRDELVMWAPGDYHRGMLMPRTYVLIGRYRATLDLSRFVHGDQWTRCYNAKTDSEDP
ncbi:hypothetical protein CERSUDRAFT_95666 [Gelatoporia subvermispora B]|uniref:Nephrocystin 3-like N-terminal domain-containing protein n=1 Tax=Ceriporiopsis subvermispora (strain B) TaxID=914234 RepID=M2PJF7_CERS8|nr:hypothetical protein CERSUDRAFT_95666 [Gelatoporia subvermispora B]